MTSEDGTCHRSRPSKRRVTMMRRTMFAGTILAICAATTVVLAEGKVTNTAPASGRYLPEYTKDGDLILPKNCGRGCTWGRR